MQRDFGARSGWRHSCRQRISAAPDDAKPEFRNKRRAGDKTGQKGPKMPTTTNRGARTSGAALPFSGRPSAGAMKHRRRRSILNRVDRGVPQEAPQKALVSTYCGTSRTTGPLTAGAAGTGAFGASMVSTGFEGLPNCPIGPYTIAATRTANPTIAPNTPPIASDVIPNTPLLPSNTEVPNRLAVYPSQPTLIRSLRKRFSRWSILPIAVFLSCSFLTASTISATLLSAPFQQDDQLRLPDRAREERGSGFLIPTHQRRARNKPEALMSRNHGRVVPLVKIGV